MITLKKIKYIEIYIYMKTFICLLCDKINNYDKDFKEWSHRENLVCS